MPIPTPETQRRILIVDDEGDIAEVLRLGLEKRGLAVDAYTDPIEALSNIAPSKYSLALFDIRMPRMNGFELFREFRKIDRSTDVIFMTAFEIHGSEFKMMFPDIEPAALLKKPFKLEELIDRVNGRSGDGSSKNLFDSKLPDGRSKSPESTDSGSGQR